MLVDFGLKFAIGSSLSALGCAKLGKILITSDAQRRIVSYKEKKTKLKKWNKMNVRQHSSGKSPVEEAPQLFLPGPGTAESRQQVKYLPTGKSRTVFLFSLTTMNVKQYKRREVINLFKIYLLLDNLSCYAFTFAQH